MEAAEKLKISAQNLNSMLTSSLESISATRKRTRKLKAVSILRKKRKKKETKIEIPSIFKKSVSKIKNKVTSGTGNLFGNILGFVSLMLLGVAITNIEEIQEKLDKAKEKLMEGIQPVIDFGKFLFNGAKGFIDLFGGQSERDKELEEIEKGNVELKNSKNKLNKLNKDYEKLEKDYENVASGKYGKGEGFSVNTEGTLSDGSTFVYDKDADKPYAVTEPNGSVKRYSFEDFVNKYRGSDLSNIYSQDVDISQNNLQLNNLNKNDGFTFDSSMIGMSDKNNFLYDFDEDMFNFDDKKIVYLQKYFVDKGNKG